MKRTILLLIIVICNSQITFSQWTQKANFPTNCLRGPTSFTIQNNGYVGCGVDTLGKMSSGFWKYDPLLDSWTPIADFGGGKREVLTTMSVQGRAFVGLGYDSTGFRTDWWEYNPLSNSWIQKSDFPSIGREFSSVFSLNGKGYIVCGYGSNHQFLNEVWEYNPSIDTWTQKYNFPGTSRMIAVGLSINNKGYICGGMHFYIPVINLPDVWSYDPINDTWQQKGNIPVAQFSDNGSFTLCNRGYVCCGELPSSYLNILWEYNPDNDSWFQQSTFPGADRDEVASFSINNKAYIGLGGPDQPKYHDLWEYTADSCFESINEVNANAINISPNPFSTTTQITLNKTYHTISLSVYDMQGKLVAQNQYADADKIQLNRKGLTNGMYFLKLILDDKEITTGKIVVSD